MDIHLHTPPAPVPSPQHQGGGFVELHHGENCGLLEKKIFALQR